MRLSTAIRLLLALVAAMVLMKYGPWLGYAMMAEPETSPARRAGATAIAVLSFLPWLVIAGWAISQADEYAQQVFLVGIALAAAGSMLAFTAFDFMRDTHIVAESAPIPWFPVMIAMWAFGTAAVSVYYRRRR
jgi:hypothetical protein